MAVFLVSLLPLARLVWLAQTDYGLGANPVEFITRSTGTWTLVFICLTLAVTPLRKLLGKPQIVRLRRMLGLYAFFYGCLHFTIWFYLDQDLDLTAMLKDVVKRPFITAGFTALVLMLPLALTSPHFMARWLGGARWRKLHRLVYVAAILHYFWHKAGKHDFGTVAIYAAVIALLLGMRLWWAFGPAGKGARGALRIAARQRLRSIA
ncbi:MAG: sulfoxide reductase heme-binding subunit YedZ [Candidatus Protistobacter heckmanni]|nr:sulfoxide reductase heme-binding subunit YedZ [Candidatus Protistobacter heckmanni]